MRVFQLLLPLLTFLNYLSNKYLIKIICFPIKFYTLNGLGLLCYYIAQFTKAFWL